jgi:hypothetical protein
MGNGTCEHTQHSTLLTHKSSKVPENLRQLMNARLDFPNFCFTLMYERFLMRKLRRRKLAGHHALERKVDEVDKLTTETFVPAAALERHSFPLCAVMH